MRVHEFCSTDCSVPSSAPRFFRPGFGSLLLRQTKLTFYQRGPSMRMSEKQVEVRRRPTQSVLQPRSRRIGKAALQVGQSGNQSNPRREAAPGGELVSARSQTTHRRPRCADRPSQITNKKRLRREKTSGLESCVIRPLRSD
jgi:hypothetical protein